MFSAISRVACDRPVCGSCGISSPVQVTPRTRDKPMRRCAVLIATALFHGSIFNANSGPVSPNALSPTRIYRVTNPLTDDKGRVAVNVSGLACMQAEAGQSKCLVIDDEGRSAQIITIGDGTAAAGARLSLVGKRPSNDTVGRPPSQINCSGGDGNFRNMDGEAVAYSSPFFYVVGSHGCSRHSNKFHGSAFVLARIPEAKVAGSSLDQTSLFDTSNVQTTYRLSEALTAASEIRQYFAKDLMSADSLNIEGLVVVGDKLFAGLRAPSLDGKAFVVAIDVDKLFDPSVSIAERDVRVFSLPLGIGRGIRDLTKLSDGRLLVLSGPAQDLRMPSEVHVFDLMNETSLLLGAISELGDAREAKAEAISVLSQHENNADVLVMFDGLENGGLREYRVLLK